MMQAAAKNISSTDTLTAAVGPLRVLIAAGGTGGHVYPGIAIADALGKLDRPVSLLFAGTRDRMEWQAVPKAGYEIRNIWISGLHRRLTPVNLLFPFKLLTSLVQSLLLLRTFRPDVVVCCGGFASGPVGWMAARLGIPLLLQEQNSYPGVTTRLLARHAEQIFTAFEEATGHLPAEKVTLTGNPVRSRLTGIPKSEGLERFGFTGEGPLLLVMGGSGGARTINDAMERNLERLLDAGIRIIWQCGSRYYRELKKRVEPEKFDRLRLLEYIDDMPAAYAAGDLVVSRAGALSCSELMLTGKPSLLIPSPNVAGDHQTRNADSMVRTGAALLLEDANAADELAGLVLDLIRDPERLEQMGRKARALAMPDAADRIAEQIKRTGEDRK